MMRPKEGSNSPRFITFEGGEGAGKTTLINEMAAVLEAQGIPVLKTREPGGTEFGNQIRSWLLDRRSHVSIGARAELLLFLSARAQHIEEVILPAIQEGKTVLCDRFNDSTVAYQGEGRGLGAIWVRALCNLICGSILPERTFYLDIDPEIGLYRTKRTVKEHAGSGELDRIEAETIEFHRRVRQAFQRVAQEEPNRFCCIDASQPKEVVMTRAFEFFMQF